MRILSGMAYIVVPACALAQSFLKNGLGGGGNSSPGFFGHKWGLPLFIFLSSSLVVGIPRVGMVYFTNDPESIKCMEATISSQSASPLDLFLRSTTTVWYDYGNASGDYRPLNSIIAIGMFLLRNHPLILIFTSSALLGVLASLIYLLVMEITQKKLISLCSVFFFSFAIPSITMTWIVINKQPLLPLIIVFGLLCYVRYQKCGRPVWLYLLWATCFIGPLFRELAGVLPLTVLFVALAEKKWDRRLLFPLPILLFHGVFPSFLINLLFYGNVVLHSVFSRGYMRVNEMSFLSSLGDFKWRVPPHFVLLLPPVLTILGLCAVVLYLVPRIKTSSSRLQTALYIVGLGFTMTFFLNKSSYIPLILLVALASFRFGKLLPIWFLVSWLPFLKIYTVDVHLVTALIPWTVMLLLWIEHFFEHIQEHGEIPGRSLARLLACGLILIAFLDHSLNLVAVRSTFSAINKGVVEMADWFNVNTKNEIALVTNFNGISLISSLAPQRVKSYWTPDSKPGGWPFSRDILGPSELEAMIRENYARQEFYLLEHLGRRVSHPYLDNPPCGRIEFVNRFATSNSYPFIDPLKHITKSKYFSFPGPPDLFGLLLKTSTGFFHRQNLIVYDLYRLRYPAGSDTGGADATPVPPPITIEEGYRKQFNITLYGRKYYGLARAEGAFDTDRLNKKDYRLCFVGDSMHEVKRQIDKFSVHGD